MKKFLFSLLAAGALTSANAQVSTIFEDSFETYPKFDIGGISQTTRFGYIGDWKVVDVDASTTYGFQGSDFPNDYAHMAFIVFDDLAVVPALNRTAGQNWGARTGSNAMAAIASTTPANDDYLISPQITLGSSDNVLRFYAKAGTAEYGYETFLVKVSTTDDEVDSFFEIGGDFIDADINYALYEYDLSEFNGQSIYIAINCTSDDQFGFLVDDFSVTGNTAGMSTSNENVKSINKIYPNPAKESFNVDLDSKFDKTKTTVEVMDLTGRVVKTFNNAASYDVSDLGKGVYVVIVNDGTNKIVKKLIKE